MKTFNKVNFNKTLSMFLALCMVFTMLPPMAQAATTHVSGTGSGNSTADPRYFDDYASMKAALEDEDVKYVEYIHGSSENLDEYVTEPIKVAGEKELWINVNNFTFLSNNGMDYLIEVPTGASLRLRAGFNIGTLSFGTNNVGLNPIFKVTGGTLNTYLCRLSGNVSVGTNASAIHAVSGTARGGHSQT